MVLSSAALKCISLVVLAWDINLVFAPVSMFAKGVIRDANRPFSMSKRACKWGSDASLKFC
jgi:hypothetical protein